MEIELDIAPKLTLIPDDLFYKCTNLQKNMEIRKYFFSRVKTELINSVYRLGEKFQDSSLTISLL
jgi:hypothetical protein